MLAPRPTRKHSYNRDRIVYAKGGSRVRHSDDFYKNAVVEWLPTIGRRLPAVAGGVEQKAA